MGFFWNTKPKVTAPEFQKVRASLVRYNFNERERDRIEEILRGDLQEKRDSDKGLDADEIDRALTWMRAHQNEHRIPLSKIDTLEKILRGKL